jgi:hypothetical protein
LARIEIVGCSADNFNVMVRDLDGPNDIIDLEAAVQTRRRSDDCGPRAY